MNLKFGKSLRLNFFQRLSFSNQSRNTQKVCQSIYIYIYMGMIFLLLIALQYVDVKSSMSRKLSVPRDLN